MLSEHDRIPLDAAHSILATFGITKPTKAYERWVHPDGFDVRDFGDVLFESQFVFVVDWREPLECVLDLVVAALNSLDVQLRFQCNDNEGVRAQVECDGRRAALKYCQPDDDRWDDVFSGLQSIAPEHIEFRGSPWNEGRDTSVFAVLPRDEWTDLERTSPDVIAHFFETLRPSR